MATRPNDPSAVERFAPEPPRPARLSARRREDRLGSLDNAERFDRYVAKVGVVEQGGRNNAAYAVARFLLGLPGETPGTAWPALLAWNETSVSPPLPEAELRAVLDSASRAGGRR